MKKPGFRQKKMAITGKEWLKFKPYSEFKAYDKTYVAIASKVHAALKAHSQFFDELFESNEQPYSDLAIILTSYLEDLVNEIGIWKVFTDTNQELYGYPLPFLDEAALENYEAGDLNFDDIQYLVWHFLNAHIDSFFAPDSILLIDATEEVWKVLDKAWDDAPVSEFYDEYFTIDEDINFFDLKNKLTWFCMDSYPLHKERNIKHLASIQNLLEGADPNSVPRDQIRQYSFMVIDEQTLISRTRYNAFLPIEWFAKVINASDEFKADCLEISKPIWGTFDWIEETETHHILKYQGLDRIFEVSKKSFQTEIAPTPEQILVMRIVPFKGEWYMSGIVSMFEDEAEKAKFKNPIPPPFNVHGEEDQQKFLENTKKMEADFREYFGSSFYLTEEGEDLLEKVTGYTQFQYQNRQAKNPKLSDFDYEEAKEKNKQIIPAAPGTAVTFIPNQGMLFEIGIKKWIDDIKNIKKLDREAGGKLMFHLSAEIYPETLTYIMETYQPDSPLLFPVDLSVIDFWPYLPFFSRYIQPDNYGPRTPFMVSSALEE